VSEDIVICRECKTPLPKESPQNRSSCPKYGSFQRLYLPHIQDAIGLDDEPPLSPDERRRRIVLLCCTFMRNLAFHRAGREAEPQRELLDASPSASPSKKKTIAERLAFASAIIDASPSDDNGILVMQFDATLSALPYVIGAIGVQEKTTATRHGEKTFVKYMADPLSSIPAAPVEHRQVASARLI
jgi:hypothetical protein